MCVDENESRDGWAWLQADKRSDASGDAGEAGEAGEANESSRDERKEKHASY